MTGPPLPEPLDPESADPPGTGPWSDDPAADWGEEEAWDDGWDPYEWWTQDDDGTAERNRWPGVRTIDTRGLT